MITSELLGVPTSSKKRSQISTVGDGTQNEAQFSLCNIRGMYPYDMKVWRQPTHNLDLIPEPALDLLQIP
jgi:hypothetical protein